jgi:hypothetical protein
MIASAPPLPATAPASTNPANEIAKKLTGRDYISWSALSTFRTCPGLVGEGARSPQAPGGSRWDDGWRSQPTRLSAWPHGDGSRHPARFREGLVGEGLRELRCLLSVRLAICATATMLIRDISN